jgi:hypothetical protein
MLWLQQQSVGLLWQHRAVCDCPVSYVLYFYNKYDCSTVSGAYICSGRTAWYKRRVEGLILQVLSPRGTRELLRVQAWSQSRLCGNEILLYCKLDLDEPGRFKVAYTPVR